MNFCPRCHRYLPLPALLRGDSVHVAGTVKLGCGWCRKGEAVLRG